jgi:hypothetical protein
MALSTECLEVLSIAGSARPERLDVVNVGHRLTALAASGLFEKDETAKPSPGVGTV